MKLSSLRSDLSKEQEGVWVEYGGGLMFKIARNRNKKMKQALVRYNRKRGRRRRKDFTADLDAMLQELLPFIAQYILLDWDNLQDDEGNNIQYSQEKAIEILGDPELEDVMTFVLECSNDAALFKQEVEEGEAGN